MINPSNDIRPIYTIDAQDRIVLRESGMDCLHQRRVAAVVGAPIAQLGQSVWDSRRRAKCDGCGRCCFNAFGRVGAPVFVPMRADTPDERRLLDIEVRPLVDRSIQHVYECVWTEARLASRIARSGLARDAREHADCCAWCRRIQVGIGTWEEIEDAQSDACIGEAASTLPSSRPAFAPPVSSRC